MKTHHHRKGLDNRATGYLSMEDLAQELVVVKLHFSRDKILQRFKLSSKKLHNRLHQKHKTIFSNQLVIHLFNRGQLNQKLPQRIVPAAKHLAKSLAQSKTKHHTTGRRKRSLPPKYPRKTVSCSNSLSSQGHKI